MRLILSLTVGLLLNVSLEGQTEEFYIEIRTDDNPQEITWQLADEKGEVLLTDESKITESSKVYISTIELPIGGCFRFDIFDSGGDGISSPGYYRLRRGNVWVQSLYQPFGLSNFHYSGQCVKGQSCEDPMPVTSSTMYSFHETDYWYYIRETQDVAFEISTCSSRDVNNNILDTELWIYDKCPERVIDGPEGALIYNDNYVTCTPGSGLFRFAVKADRDYYVRIRSKDPMEGKPLVTNFEKFQNIYGCMDAKSCTYNPLATEDDGTCTYSDCLPDLAIGQEEFKSSIKLDKIIVEDNCLLEESCVTGLGVRDLVRFSTVIYNIGEADYIVGNPEYGGDNFSINNCHGHWHQLGYAEYLLYSGAGSLEPVGFKNGFCLLDISCDNGSTSKYSCAYMGVTAGCFDVYDSSVECQWIDVTDVPDGSYTLVARINWRRQPDLRGMQERTFDNNWVQSCILLDRSSGTLELSILDDCPIYEDCLGSVNGQAVLDCKGTCGGSAHYGDINLDQEISASDIEDYLEEIKSGSSVSSCTDLDGNGSLSIYDVTLLKECLTTYENNQPHTHCIFPNSVNNESDTASLIILGLNTSDRTIDIGYSSLATPLMAFDFKVSGLGMIESVELLADVEFDNGHSETGRFYGLSSDENFLSAGSDIPLIRFKYSEIVDNEICIAPDAELVNSLNQKLTITEGVRQCELISNIINIKDVQSIALGPNPASDILTISYGHRTPEYVSIINMEGRLMSQVNTYSNINMSIDMGQYPQGLYLIKIQYKSQTVIAKVVLL